MTFFASWCPVCDLERAEVAAVQTSFAAQGLQVIGVLLDPRETPETVGDARERLSKSPPPFPVVLMSDSVQSGFRSRLGEFPATYFISEDGRFSTTLFGLQPKARLVAELERIVTVAAAAAAPAPAEAREGRAGPPWANAPWLALFPRRWKQWHPLVIHFPIALLALEALLVVAAVFGSRPGLERLARSLLGGAVASFVPAIYTGVGDAGAGEGGTWSFLAGLKERVGHLFLLESTVSVHVLFALAAVLLATARFAWWVRRGERPLSRPQRAALALVAVIGLWALFAAGQVGGSISHP